MNEKQKQRSDALQYSAAGIQMVLTILLFTYLGTRLDKYFETEKPLWTALLAIFGVVIALIFMLKSFMKPTQKKKPNPNGSEDKKSE